MLADTNCWHPPGCINSFERLPEVTALLRPPATLWQPSRLPTESIPRGTLQVATLSLSWLIGLDHVRSSRRVSIPEGCQRVAGG
jgi:hypothetical protein